MAISVVQHASNTAVLTSGTSATTTATFTNNVASGNCIVACISIISPFTTPSITSVTTNGSAENWASALSGNHFVGFLENIFVNPSSGGGQKIIDVNWAFGGTATATNAPGICIDVFEISGVASSGIVDKTSKGNNNTGLSWTSGATATTTQANEIWIGMVNLDPSSTSNAILTGPSSPWTNEAQLNATTKSGSSNVPLNMMSGFQIVSSTGTATYSGSSNLTIAAEETLVVTLFGSTAAPVAPVPANPGRSWKRRFKRQTQHSNFNATDIASATFTATATFTSSSIVLPNFVAQRANPGKTWRRRYNYPEHLQAPYPPGLSYNTATFTATSTFTSNNKIEQSFYPSGIQPGRTWKKRFTRRQQQIGLAPPPVTAAFTASGTFTSNSVVTYFNTASFNGTSAFVSSAVYNRFLPPTQIAPGRTWRRRFRKHALQPKFPVKKTHASANFNGDGEFVSTNGRLIKTLIVSVAAQAGTDSFGNNYVQGVGIYGYGKLVSPEIDIISNKGGLFVYRSGN